MRGRFAPSPTGYLHLGNARTALLAWLAVRSRGGEFLLRIEDLDVSRCRDLYVDSLFRDMEYLGLTWDEAPWFQSRRFSVYDEAIEQLAASARIYSCFCSRADIARTVTAPHGPTEEGPVYPGTCAQLSDEQRLERERSRAPSLRFRVPSDEIAFVDEVCGRCCSVVKNDVGDFVVRRHDGVPSYQLAVVVDDALSQINHVLRGDDLLGSTPRQIALYEALSYPLPQFAHVPLVLGSDGKRLAKRHPASTVMSLRESRVPPERVIGLLASWSGLGDGTPIRAEELVSAFSLARLPSTPAMASEADLDLLIQP